MELQSAAQLQRYHAIADAISGLFLPHVEVVIHDLVSETVAYVANPLSKRRIGDPSGDQPFEDRPGDAVIGPYRKMNTDGRNFRSTTAVIRDETGHPIAYFCINFDVSTLESIGSQLAALAFLPGSLEPHPPFFHDNWRQSLERVVNDCEAAAGVPASVMTPQQRAELLMRLDADGVLDVRNAPKVVAERMGFSRAALYKHLKRIRASGHQGAATRAQSTPGRDACDSSSSRSA